MYTAVWNRYPHGIEGEAMECKQRDFETLEKAIAFLASRVNAIRGIYWAGGYVEDKSFNFVYEILDNGEIVDNTKVVTAAAADALKEKYIHIVERYKVEKQREFFNSYVIGVIKYINNESTYSNNEKVRNVADVLRLVDILEKEG